MKRMDGSFESGSDVSTLGHQHMVLDSLVVVQGMGWLLEGSE